MHEWTEKKFAAFNLAFLRRQVVDSMEAKKLAMISGLYANTNLDDGKGTRQNIINGMEENFKAAIKHLYDPQKEEDIVGNPFFDAMNVPGEDLDWAERVDDMKPSIDLDADLPDKPIIISRPRSAVDPVEKQEDPEIDQI